MSYEENNGKGYFIYSMVISIILIVACVGFVIDNIVNKNSIKVIKVKEYQIDTLYINDSIIGYNIKYVKSYDKK